MTNLNVVGILTRVAALSALATDATFASAVNTAFGPSGSKVLAGMGIVAAIAGEVIHFLDSSSSEVTPVVVVNPPTNTPPAA